MRGLAISSLVLGIIGILFCWIGIGIIPAVLALIFGFIACFNRSARGMAVAGLVLGIIGTIISAGVIYLGSHPEKFLKYAEQEIKRKVVPIKQEYGKKFCIKTIPVSIATEQLKEFDLSAEPLKKVLKDDLEFTFLNYGWGHIPLVQKLMFANAEKVCISRDKLFWNNLKITNRSSYEIKNITYHSDLKDNYGEAYESQEIFGDFELFWLGERKSRLKPGESTSCYFVYSLGYKIVPEKIESFEVYFGYIFERKFLFNIDSPTKYIRDLGSWQTNETY